MSTFSGFPVEALDFYDDLEIENTKTYWEANRHVYQESVLAPMRALAAGLDEEFGPAKIYRPYRDLRFRKDRSAPYKIHQGAFVAHAPETGFYVEISARGVRTSGGCYWFSPDRLAAYRRSVADDRLGSELESLVSEVVGQGYTRGGERLKTRPRGYDQDHPRIDLLRHTSLTVGRMIGFEPVIHTPELLDLVRADWRALRPVVTWIADHAQA